MKRIGLLHFEDMEELDAIGPYEVLAFWTRNNPDDGWECVTFSADGGAVTCAKGLSVNAHTSVGRGGPARPAAAPRRIRDQGADEGRGPSGLGPRPATGDPHQRLHRFARLCRGRPARRPSGHHALGGDPDCCATPTPPSTYARTRRYVDDGDVVTSAGVSAGIDMALHLVARLASRNERERWRAASIRLRRVRRTSARVVTSS